MCDEGIIHAAHLPFYDLPVSDYEDEIDDSEDDC